MTGPAGHAAADRWPARPAIQGELLASRIEDAGLNASAPTEQLWLDGWLLRLSPGTVKRARCINAVAEGRLPFADRLQLALEAYREAGLAPMLRITPFTRPAHLEADIAALGWPRFDDTQVMVLEQLPPPGARAAVDGPMPTPQPVTALEYAEIVGALRGTPSVQRAVHARRLHASPVAYCGWVVRDGPDVLACGQYAREGALVGLYDVHTATHARGRGLATRLCGWLLARAAEEGARHAYLQVGVDNLPAQSIYRRLGFSDLYRYHYRAPDPAAVG